MEQKSKPKFSKIKMHVTDKLNSKAPEEVDTTFLPVLIWVRNQPLKWVPTHCLEYTFLLPGPQANSRSLVIYLVYICFSYQLEEVCVLYYTKHYWSTLKSCGNMEF